MTDFWNLEPNLTGSSDLTDKLSSHVISSGLIPGLTLTHTVHLITDSTFQSRGFLRTCVIQTILTSSYCYQAHKKHKMVYKQTQFVIIISTYLYSTHYSYCLNFDIMFSAIKKLFFPTPLSTHFDVLQKLGSGGYGTVYLARRKQDNLTVAVKKIKKRKVREYVTTPVGDLPLEIYIAMSMSHPNIIKTSGFLKSGGSWCMVMEHCVGYLDLTSYVHFNNNLSQITARKIFIQTYKALTYCFRQNVVHKDIKTDNILVHWSTHHVKLIDFGVSSFVTANTQVNEDKGTDIFMPPEFFIRRSYDPLCGTVWALGCLLYCMLYGEVPFVNVEEVLNKQLTFPKLSGDLNSQYCLDLLERCLDKNENDRVTYKNISYHPWIARPSQGVST